MQVEVLADGFLGQFRNPVGGQDLSPVPESSDNDAEGRGDFDASCGLELHQFHRGQSAHVGVIGASGVAKVR